MAKPVPPIPVPGPTPKWEPVASDPSVLFTDRLVVPGGWLYRAYSYFYVQGQPPISCITLQFVPTPPA